MTHSNAPLAAQSASRLLAAALLSASLAQYNANGQGRARTMTPQQIAQRALPAVVFVVSLDSKGQPVARGSAFFIAPHLLLTNFHVVEQAGQIRVSPVTESTK